GTGVALGWEHIVQELLDDGRLVAVGPAVETGVHFPLLSRAGRPLSPGAATLRAWLLANAPG
ncbi:MAG: LysR family transcriptional regulator, partial [Actinomycetota bacterium]